MMVGALTLNEDSHYEVGGNALNLVEEVTEDQ